ncbi:hypothetical protein MRB53_026041 [Persea americana]|uniref:Uncharacterized protein n=1 Tax=Persea americana TaxID=3435 RepID=A0ACC2LHG9_PERAE|nr:hypothetical protein MRB53_026041 [Persea americana]
MWDAQSFDETYFLLLEALLKGMPTPRGRAYSSLEILAGMATTDSSMAVVRVNQVLKAPTNFKSRPFVTFFGVYYRHGRLDAT